MYKLLAVMAVGVSVLVGLSACKPGVYYPFGGGPPGQYYVPDKGLPAQPAPKPALPLGTVQNIAIVAS